MRNQTEYNLYVGLELAGCLKDTADYHGDKHKHAFWELIYMAKSDCVMTVENQDYTVCEGEGLLVKPLESHCIRAVQSTFCMTYIGFRFAEGQEIWLDSEERLMRPHAFSHEKLFSALTQLQNEAFIHSGGGEIIQGLIPVAEWIQQKAERPDQQSNRQKSILCAKTIKYIKSNMDRFVSVEEIAASLYVTPHYLGLVFSSCMGKTILKYQQSAKMEIAAKMIRDGEKTMTEISDCLGFSSPQYFTKCFKSYYGFAPSQMKKLKLP